MTENIPGATYEGSQPYIFISYAHNDAAGVLPVVARLQADGCRVWFDQGILPGKAWDENVGEKLAGCQCLIAFVSRSYIASSNCRDELSMGRRLGKNMLLVYLEDVQLTPGMKMRYSRLFALFRHRMPEEEFFSKLYTMENIDLTKE
jgi:hypothetical protein